MVDGYVVCEFFRVIVLLLLLGVKFDCVSFKDDYNDIDYIWRDLSSYNIGYFLFW